MKEALGGDGKLSQRVRSLLGVDEEGEETVVDAIQSALEHVDKTQRDDVAALIEKARELGLDKVKKG